MKKSMRLIAFFSVMFFIVLSSFSQNSNLVFFTQGSEPFFVFLNGVKQNPNIGNSIKIFGLDENRINVLILIPHPAFAMVNNSIKITLNKESVFAIAKNLKGDYELIPRGENQLSFNPASPNQQIIKFASHLPPVSPMPLGVGAGLNILTGNPNQTASPYTGTTTTISNGNAGNPATVNYLPGYNGPIGCPVPMALQQFQSAKNSISSKSFESAKITIAKQIAGSNCLFASQVKDIMSLFSFEGTKIEFAKFAFAFTYDKGNYFIVNDAFDFDSSISELNKYIGK